MVMEPVGGNAKYCMDGPRFCKWEDSLTCQLHDQNEEVTITNVR